MQIERLTLSLNATTGSKCVVPLWSDSEIIALRCERGTPVIYALTAHEGVRRQVTFMSARANTPDTVPDNAFYVGSFESATGAVLHVFEEA